MTLKRNGAFDWWKFVFVMIYVVFSAHLIETDGAKVPAILERGSLAVDYFFILAGIMLAKSVNSLPSGKRFEWSDFGGFLYRRLRRFYPAFAVCWLVSFIAVNTTLFENMQVLFYNVFTSIMELLLIRNAGFNSYRVMSQTWAISAGMISLFLLYPLYARYKKAFENYIAPVGALLLLGYICYQKSSIVGDSDYLRIGFKCTYRALGEILLGVTCYVICRYLWDREVSKQMSALLAAAEVGGYLMMIGYMQYYRTLPRYFDFLFVGILAMSMTITLSRKSIISGLCDRRLFYFLGRFSLYPFLTFKAFTKILPTLLPDLSGKMMFAAYIGLTLLSAAVLMAIEKPLIAAVKRFKRLIVKPRQSAADSAA